MAQADADENGSDSQVTSKEKKGTRRPEAG
jgi:hypothetical protein